MSRKGGSRGAVGADGIDYGPLQNWVGFHLRMAQSASFQAFARLTQEEKIQPGRFATLLLIGRNPGISQTLLSQANGRDKSTLTPVLNDLVRRGLVRRERTPSDRRAYRLALTAAGARKLARLNACAIRHDRNLDRIIGAAERERFLATLRRIEAALIPHWSESAEPASAPPAGRVRRARRAPSRSGAAATDRSGSLVP